MWRWGRRHWTVSQSVFWTQRKTVSSSLKLAGMRWCLMLCTKTSTWGLTPLKFSALFWPGPPLNTHSTWSLRLGAYPFCFHFWWKPKIVNQKKGKFSWQRGTQKLSQTTSNIYLAFCGTCLSIWPRLLIRAPNTRLPLNVSFLNSLKKESFKEF